MDRYPPPFGCRSTALRGLTSLLAYKIGTANSEPAIQGSGYSELSCSEYH